MADKSFVELLNDQVAHEFAAHQQYVANAVYYEAETLPRLAAFYYRQALEERNHAMMIIQYLLDAHHDVVVPPVAAPRNDFDDIVAPARLGLEQEKQVSAQINALSARAREEGDYQGEQFLQWFIKEQGEEVATATDLLTVIERARDNPLQAEEYLAREGFGEEAEDPTAPPAAGGSV